MVVILAEVGEGRICRRGVFCGLVRRCVGKGEVGYKFLAFLSLGFARSGRADSVKASGTGVAF